MTPQWSLREEKPTRGEGMLGVLVQCTRRHSFAVRTVEALQL